MEVGSVEARLAVDVSQWQAGFREAGSQAESFGKNADSVFARLAKQVESAFGSLAQELRAVTTSLKEVVQEFRASTGQVASALGVMADRSRSAHQDAANAAKVAAQQAAEASRQASRLEAAEARASSQEQIVAAKAAAAAAREAAREKEAEAKRAAAAALAAEKQAEREASAAAKAAAQERIQAARQAHEQEQALAKQTLAAQKAALKEGLATQKAAMQENLAAQRDAAQAIKGDGAGKRDYSDGLQTIGYGLSSAGASGQLAFGGATKMFMEYESELRNVNSMAKLSEAEFQKLYDTVLKMSTDNRLATGPRNLAKALADIQGSGIEGKDAQTVLLQAAKMSDASGGRAATDTTTSALVTALQSYGADASRSSDYADMMALAVDKGRITWEQMAHGLGMVSSAAAQAKVPFKELNAMIAVATVKGLSVDETFSSIRQAINQITAPSEQAKKALEKLKKAGIDIDVSEQAVKAKGPMTVLKDLFEKTGGNAEVLRDVLGDINAVNVAKVLAGDGGKMFDEINSTDQKGYVDKQRAEQAKSLSVQMKQLWAQLEADIIRVGSVMKPYMQMVADVITVLAKKFEELSHWGQKVAVVMGALATGASVLMGGLTLLAPSVASVASLFTGGALAAGATAVGSAMAALAPIALALGAAAAVLYVAWTDNWGGIKEKTYAAAETIKGYLEVAFNWCKNELPRIWTETWQSIRFTLNRVWEEVQPGLQSFVSGVLDIWESVEPMLPLMRAGFTATWENLKIVFAGISAAWDFSWQAVKGTFSVVWPLIVSALRIGIEAMKGVFGVGLALMEGDWGKAWDRMKDALSKVWGLMAGAVKSAVSNMLNALTEQIGSFANVGERLMRAFADGIRRGSAMATGAAKEATEELETRGFVKDSRGVRDYVTGALPAPPYNVSAPVSSPGALVPPPVPKRATDDSAREAQSRKVGAITAEKAPKKAPKTMLQELLELQRQQYSGATVTSGFSDDRGVSVYRRTPGKHSGYDIAMPAGTEVAAAWPGRVTAIIPWGQGEFGVEVQGGGRKTTYGHISPLVQEGQEIGHGTALGRVSKDHVDVKMKDPSGKYVDFGKITATSQSKSLADDLAKMVRQYVGSGSDSKTPESRLEKAAKERDINLVAASTPKDKLDVERRYQQEVRKIHLEMQGEAAESESRSRQLTLEAMGATHELELEKIRESYRIKRAAIQKEINDGLPLDSGASAAVMGANAGVAIPQMATLDQSEQNALREAELKFEQELPSFIQKRIEMMKQADTVLQKTFETNAKLRDEHKLTLQGQLDADATALNSYIGTEEGKQQARIQYGELYKQYLEQQLQVTTDDQTVVLQKTLDNALLLDQSLVANQVQVSVIQDALRAARIAKMQQERAQILAIGQQLAGSFEQFLVGVTAGQTKFNDAFKSLWQSITQTVIKYVAEMILKVLALQKIMQAAFSFFGFGIGGAATSIGGSLGGGFGDLISGGLTAFHSGGLVGRDGIQVLHAGGFAGLDIRPDEVLAKLQVGEMVLSRSQVEEARRAGASRPEQPGVFAPSLTIETVYIREEADIDRLATAIAQRQREEWQAW